MAIIKRTDVIEADAIQQDLKEIRIELDKITKSVLDLQKAKRSQNDASTGADAKKAIDLTNQLEKATVKLAAAQTEEGKQLAKLKVLTQEKTKATKTQVREELGLVGAYERESKELISLRKQYKDLIIVQGKETKQTRALRTEINKLDTQLKKVDASLGQHQRNVGNYGKALKGVGIQLLGAAGIVGGVDLLVDGFREFNKTAKQVNDLTRKIGTNFKVFGDAAKGLAAQINAIATTFEKDYNEILVAANTVQKEFGITAEESFNLIEEGFLKGSDNSGEFLDILREYPAQFKAAGIDAETTFAIINQQVREGIYSDKGVDAIKEAGLRLRENTKAVQDALKPLDESIKKQIEQEIAAGNTFKAIQLVSEALKDTSLTAQQTQTLIADVFGGPGEDAGLRYLQTLSDIETSLENVSNQASESEQASLNLSKSWNQFVASVSDSDGIFSQVWATFKDLLSGAINGVTILLKFINGTDKSAKKLENTLTKVNVKIRGQKEETEELDKSNKNYINSAGNLVTADGKIIKTKAQLIREYKEQLELQKEATRRAKIAAENEQVQTLTTRFGADEVTGGFDPVKSALETTKSVNENIQAENARLRQEELEREQEYQEARKQLGETFLNETANFARSIFDTQQQERLTEIESQAEAEKDILKQQLEDGEITQEEFAKKSLEIDKKANREKAKLSKRTALFEIAINTAVAIVKALPNLIAAGLVAVQGAIQAAFVAAKPLPAFKEGVIGFKGKGSDTSDSNTVRISNNESVITAKGTKNAPMALSAINDGLISDSDLVKRGVSIKGDSSNFNMLLSEQKKTNAYLSNGVNQINENGVLITYYMDGTVKRSYGN